MPTRPQPSRPSKFLTTSGAARLLERSEAFVREWERLGVLRAERTQTGIRLFRRTDIERLVQGRRDRDPEAPA